MSLQHIQKNSPGLLPKPAKFEKNPPNGYRVIRKTKCGAGGAGSSPIHKQASLAGRLNSTGPFDLGSENPDRSRSATNSPVNRESTDVAPPFFLSFQSRFEKGKIEREGLSSVPEEIKFPREASQFFFFVFFFTICTYLHIYNIPSLLGLVVHLLGSHYRSQVEKL